MRTKRPVPAEQKCGEDFQVDPGSQARRSVNPVIADALCRRLLPAGRFTAALRLLSIDLADVCDAAFGVREANRLVAGDYFFFAGAALRLVFFTVFFAADFVFGFVAFFAILPS